MGAGAHEEMGGTAYCVAENGGAASSESDGDPFNNVEVAFFTVMLGASNTVNMGTMQAVAPTFGSEHEDSDR